MGTSIIPYPFAFIPPAMSSALPPLGRNQASIDYTIKRNAGNIVRVYNPCGFTPIAQAEIHPSFGKYISRRMAIDIPNAVIASDIPKPGDFFTGPDGNTYNVLDCQNPSIFVQRVVGWCPAISLPLADTVQYVAATGASSSTTARTVTDTPTGSPIAAAIQPMTAALGLMYGTKNFTESYLIYTATDPSGNGPSVVNAGDLFTDQNSVSYEIEEVLERNRLDFLPAFKCRKKL